ncbi:replication restart helicase PriA [Ferruginibacter sp. SUN106]|uniref:replication restart helicase PriA n=1 Tax=Ferruginibacter sp. SUN106 TaxID=2978348 RepID=UPI003D362FD4
MQVNIFAKQFLENNTNILFTEPSSGLWAEVILPLALPQTYTYSIPVALADKVKPGCRAEVELKNKKYAGVIKTILDKEPAYKTKPVMNVLDDEPILYPQQLQLWQWMAQYYMCSEGEVMAAALPAHFKLSSETILLFNDEAGEDFSHLGDEEFLVAEALLIKKELRLSEVQQILDINHVYPVIKKLIEKKVCIVWESLDEKYKAKKENYVVLNPAFNNEEELSKKLNDWKGAPKQMELLLAYLHLEKSTGDVLQTDLLKKSGATAAQLKGLTDKNILWVEKRSVDRIKTLPRNVDVDFEFSTAQQEASDAVAKSFDKKNVCLLHGVTGSGKTQVYVKLMEQYFKAGQQVLYLLPEIALTAQIIRRLQKHFGGNIAIYHSKFNDNERIELWNKIRTGEVKMVLGARSALFLPFKNLGLIIVDEEHDASYKQQDPSPRYNARDAAIYYAGLFKAQVLLGSATPSVESYFNAVNNKYALVELNERFGGINLPSIEIVDVRQVAKKGKVMISPQLKEAMQQSLDADRQVILFQNRRGYNPYLICGTCGFIPQCEHCSVSLTLHKHSNKLHCHYCASQYPKLITCPACGNNNWLEKNFGTEKIEEQLEEDFPKNKIARMDVDSVRGKKAHDNLIQLFEQHRLDILVGTQMVVKGLDFDKVSLVGILDADGLLSFADFRVNERAFQLMEQVSGRAGRKNAQGKVVIQATNVKHPVLQLVQQHDYKKMYENEIVNRKEFFYPPYSRIVLLTLKHKDKTVVANAADRLAALLRQDLKDYIVGPAAPVINRIRNQYLMEILIKLPKEHGMSMTYKKVIRNHINLLGGEKSYKSVHVVADVDTN